MSSENKGFFSRVSGWFSGFFGNQDLQQKANVVVTVTVETYRVLVSSLLVLFVPQDCFGKVCTMSENMVWLDRLYNSALIVNFVTLGSFVILYMLEVNREYKLINYLEVNKNLACDNDSVGKALERLPVQKKNSILWVDYFYQKVGFWCVGLFGANTILSGFIIYKYYLDNQTTTTYITNVLFMITKVIDIYYTVNTDKNVFYSAYLRSKVQYNDVDPDKMSKSDTIELVPVPQETIANNSEQPSGSV